MKRLTTAMKCNWRLPYGAKDFLESKGVVLEMDEDHLTHHTHPVSAVIRNWFEMENIRHFRDRRIKSVGGNDVRHARDHGFARIHSCCPVLDGCDEIRNMKRNGKVRGDHCNLRFEDCQVAAGVYLFSHSMYYITREQLSHVPSGTYIVAIHNVYPGPGIYTFGEQKVTQLADGRYQVSTRGNDHPYTHAPVWLSSECCISTGYTTIAFAAYGRIDTTHCYRGEVRAASVFDMLLEPVEVPYESPTTELIEHLVPEFTGVSVTTRLIHTGQLRARTFFSSQDKPIPEGVDDQVLIALQRGMDATLRTWGQIDLEKMTKVNELINCIQRREEEITLWMRWRELLWTYCPATRVTSVLAYVLPITRAQAKALYEHSKSRLAGGFDKFMRRFSHVKHKNARWFDSRWFPGVPTYIPANTYENELTSIFTRSLPPTRPITIDPTIREAAASLARRIGRVDRPMDFETWVSRFKGPRQNQLKEARYCRLQYAVEFFQKIEQLDDVKHPRAIQARVDAYKAHIGPWMAAFEERCRARLPIFIKGLNPEEKAAAIAKLAEISDQALEIDFSRFDRSLSRQLLDATEQVIYSECFPPQVVRALRMQLKNYVRTRNNAAYYVDGTRMSGDVNTSIGNCLVNASLMLAMGIPLHNLKVEGDDMLAAVTPKIKKAINLSLLTKAGLTPVAKFLPMADAEFCSRRLVMAGGKARLCRDPRREIRRTGYSIHDETEKEKLDRGVHEWAGLPMFGPLYQKAAKIDITPISPATREQFAKVWGISYDEQRKFEEDDQFRRAFAQEIASPGAPPTGDRNRTVQRAPQPSSGGNDSVPVHSRVERTPPPRREGKDVRDVSATGTRESAVQGSGGNNGERGSTTGSGLRREGLGTDVPRDRGVVPESDVPRLEGLHVDHPSQPSDETKVAGNSH